ncbi:hypothetical protein A5724_10535 [Mycobacterium sp. ACS1612]|nr:hypothetical protein A5724_10535 [Mycobacterium sp. ACS1612]
MSLFRRYRRSDPLSGRCSRCRLDGTLVFALGAVCLPHGTVVRLDRGRILASLLQLVLPLLIRNFRKESSSPHVCECYLRLQQDRGIFVRFNEAIEHLP